MIAGEGSVRIWAAAIALAVSAVVIAYYAWNRPALNVPRTPPSVRPDPRATNVSLPGSVTTSGTVRLRSGALVRVGSQVSGVVKKLYVTVGSRIRRGEVIAEIDPRSLQARLAQAQAQVELDEIALEKAQRDFERVRDLAEAHLVPRQQADDLALDLKSATARLTRSESDLGAAKIELSYTVIRAPISGTVATVSTQEGETVAASFAAPTFVTLVADGALELVAMVDETDIAGVRPGEPISFTVEAYPARTFAAIVRRIDPTASIISGVVNYPVIGAIAGDLEPLKPDMTANITIDTAPLAGNVRPQP